MLGGIVDICNRALINPETIIYMSQILKGAWSVRTPIVITIPFKNSQGSHTLPTPAVPC
jgi:hypothetical protein